jgi:hypothetical protein
MASVTTKSRFLALVLFVGVLLGGCGGTSGSTGSRAGGAGDPPSTEPSKQFQNPAGADGKEAVATFGQESSETERAEASSVLTENLTARQEADFATQCATLGKRGLEAVLGEGKKAPGLSKCKTELETLANPLSKTKGIRADTLDGEIAALRVKGGDAYALYHGSDGHDHAMPMEDEGGGWKVGAIVTTELPQAQPKAKSQAHKKKNG